MPGFTGQYCEIECGLTFFKHNLTIFKQNQKIFGGSTVVASSWPSIAYILFKYGDYFYLPEYDLTKYKSKAFVCGGTLIDR